MRRHTAPEYQLDPEIERTFRRLLRERQGFGPLGAAANMAGNGPRTNDTILDSQGSSVHHSHDHYQDLILNANVIDLANDRDRPMRDYAVFDPTTMHTGIVRPDITAAHFEFKPMMFQMLQTVGQFGGTPQEDPHLHLKQFLEVCSNFKLNGVTDEAFRLRLFPYSLKDRAKAWLNSLEPNSITDWNGMAEKFLTKYFPPIKNARMRNDITSFRQTEEESLFETWERFKELLRKCPHHGIPICIQMETFYNGLTARTRDMLDASSGGALLAQSYNDAYEKIETIAANSYQWPTARLSAAKKVAGVHEVSEMTALSAQVASIANMLKNLNTASASTAPAPAPVASAETAPVEAKAISCVYCGGGHLYEECPSNPVSVNYVGNFNKNNNPYSNTYNPGWKNHPNFSWSNNNPAAPATVPARPTHPPGFPAQPPQKPAAPVVDNSIEALLKTFMTETREKLGQIATQGAAIKNLENQVGQMATVMNQRPSGSLPATTEAPKPAGPEQIKAISLRSGTELPGPSQRPEVAINHPSTEKEKEAVMPKTTEQNSGAIPAPVSAPAPVAKSPPAAVSTRLIPEVPPPPFPQRLKKAHQDKQFDKFIDVLKQLHINIPLVDALQQMPNYTKFMKDVLTKKRRLGEFETVAMTQECSMLMQSKIPQKLKDPGCFTIPCTIGDTYCGRALCDLGASINLMPKSIFQQLGIGNARPTTLTLQLADRTLAYPEGKIEDVLVKVDKLVFPADFIILDFEADAEVPIILGRPFLATGKTLIDV